MLRVGLDYRPALVNPEGIGRYARELVRALLESGEELELGLFGYTFARRRASLDELGIRDPRAELARLRIPSRWMPRFLRAIGRGVDDLVGAPAVYHHTQYSALRIRRAAEVVTVHDCMYLHDADYVERAVGERMAESVRAMVKNARRILVPSQFVGTEVVMHFGVFPNRIVVTPLGGDHFARAWPEGGFPSAREPYLLTVSRVEKRKNHVRMLRAFERLVAEGFPHRWVIAGAPGYGADDFERALAASPARDRVDWRRYVPEGEILRLTAQADLVLFLSLSEGFGLPVLEAMIAGTAVLTSCVTSMPEVAGDAASFAEPTDVDAIFEEMRRVLADDELRADLVRRGRERARRFPWSETARHTLAAYRGAVLPPTEDGPPMRRTP